MPLNRVVRLFNYSFRRVIYSVHLPIEVWGPNSILSIQFLGIRADFQAVYGAKLGTAFK